MREIRANPERWPLYLHGTKDSFSQRFSLLGNLPSDRCRHPDREAKRKDRAQSVREMTFFLMSFLPFLALCSLRFAIFHRITLSALASTLGGIVRPICLAVLRLITRSSFVGRSTGSSPAFAPLRILSTSRAAWRAISESL